MANAGYEHAGLAGTYLGLAETKPVNSMPGHYVQMARMHADSAVTLLESLGDLNALSNAVETQSKIEDGRQLPPRIDSRYASRCSTIPSSTWNATASSLRRPFNTSLKKEAAAKAEQEKKDIRQRNIRNSITAGLGGALIFLVVVYRQRNRISKEKNEATVAPQHSLRRSGGGTESKGRSGCRADRTGDRAIHRFQRLYRDE